MTETKIRLDELEGKILGNAILGSRVIEEEDKERLYASLKNRTLATGLIGLLGKPIVYSSVGIRDINDHQDGTKNFFENKYWLAWGAKAGLEIDYQDFGTHLPARYESDNNVIERIINWDKRKIQRIPEFERVTVRKRIHMVQDMSVHFEYFFEKGKTWPFLSDINSGIDLASYKHNTFFPKYFGVLNKVKRGYDYAKPAYVQKIRINQQEFLKEMRKLLVSEGAFRPLFK